MEKDKKALNGDEELFVKYSDEITPAYQRAVREALARHKKAGNSIAVSKDGKVAIIKAAEIDVEPTSK